MNDQNHELMLDDTNVMVIEDDDLDHEQIQVLQVHYLHQHEYDEYEMKVFDVDQHVQLNQLHLLMVYQVEHNDMHNFLYQHHIEHFHLRNK